jgi:hypothetical protein
MHIECKEGRAKDNSSNVSGKGKGVHNYLGNMDLLIAYYLYLCVISDKNFVGVLDFTRFSVFYIKELPEAPNPVWDSVAHPNLCDFIFDRNCPNAHKERVTHASNRLIDLYEKTCKPLIPVIMGSAYIPLFGENFGTAREKFDSASKFFISSGELESTYGKLNLLSVVSENISSFIPRIGIAATLWHIRRYLLGENPRLRQLVEEWMRSHLVKEWTNIRENSPFEMDLSQAQLIYQMQNVLLPERLLGSPTALGTGAEFNLVNYLQETAIKELISECGRCSIFKAAARLDRWQFTQPAPPALHLYSGLSSRSSFSARFISLRSAMTAPRLTVGGCQGASNRTARRRGCRGRRSADSLSATTSREPPALSIVSLTGLKEGGPETPSF